MIGRETREVERKALAILEILRDSQEPLGGRAISRRLQGKGISLGERAVRYHLRMMDERGLTQSIGLWDGRRITQSGLEELHNGLVSDKVGFLSGKIDLLGYLTTFDLDQRIGNIPIDVSLIGRDDFKKALETMQPVFKAGLCISDLVAVAESGQKLGEVVIPEGNIGLATVSSIIVSGTLLKSGIPIDSRFGGLVQVRTFEPCRFVDFIEYHGSTIDPLEIFISSRMTDVLEVARNGHGTILASFHEIPMLSRPATEAVLERLKKANLCNSFTIGKTTDPLCEIPVTVNKIGLILFSGLNPAAAVAEAGIEIKSKSMGGIIEVGKLKSFWEL
jgi:repressor of nif and glnA expression